MNSRHVLRLTILLSVLLSVVACGGLINQKSRKSSSVVEYLYPGKQPAGVKPSVPELRIPINVGIAFVPAVQQRYARYSMDQALQNSLMKQVADNFRQHKFINKIEVIPAAYLRPAGGFDNLDQLKTMYGIDVIALLSFDQVQYTDEGLVSLAYWTIVGAYIFRGEKNDTSTMVDAAVFDIPSRKLLFRAPGTSQVKSTATIVNLSEELRKNSHEGFRLATIDMISNLDSELNLFREKVKKPDSDVKLVYQKGYKGGGSLGIEFALLFLACLLLVQYYAYRNKNQKQ